MYLYTRCIGYREGCTEKFNKYKKLKGYLAIEMIAGQIYDKIEPFTGHRGYDFTCGKGYKVDVKTAVRVNNSWSFTLKNTHNTAEYYLLIAFENRNYYNPVHMWMNMLRLVGILYLITPFIV